MASIPNSLKSAGPTTEIAPGGSRKVCVLNDDRQTNQAIKGEWITPRVLPESGLSKDTYQLSEATKASNDKDALLTGQVLFSDSKVVYQLSGKGMVEHPRSAFAKLEAKGEKIVDGRSYTVAHANGEGVISNAQTASVAQPRATPKDHGVPI